MEAWQQLSPWGPAQAGQEGQQVPCPVRFALGGTAGEGLGPEDLHVPSIQKQSVILCSPEQ